MRSCNSEAMLVLQADGNVVLYDDAGVSWVPANTLGRGTTLFQMQHDGNLVAYNATLQAIWASNTGGHPGAWLAIQEDCNLVIYRGPYPERGVVLWGTGSLCRAAPPTGGRMLPGAELSYGLSFSSDSGNATLGIQADGTVVLRTGSRVLWTAPNTTNRATRSLIMQGDGNLVAYDRSGPALWASGTAGLGAWLALQDDCNLVLYQGPHPERNAVLWATMTSCSPPPVSPVTGPIRVSKQPNVNCSWPPLPTWIFCQDQANLHRVGGGLAGADDTYAWDANLADYQDTGKPVYATAPGRVVRYGGTYLPGAASGAVLIEHNSGGRIWWSGYLHMTGIRVAVDQAVTEGTLIGYVGDVGTPGVHHLHFAMYTGTNTVGGLRSYDGVFTVRN